MHKYAMNQLIRMVLIMSEMDPYGTHMGLTSLSSHVLTKSKLESMSIIWGINMVRPAKMSAPHARCVPAGWWHLGSPTGGTGGLS